MTEKEELDKLRRKDKAERKCRAELLSIKQQYDKKKRELDNIIKTDIYKQK